MVDERTHRLILRVKAQMVLTIAPIAAVSPVPRLDWCHLAIRELEITMVRAVRMKMTTKMRLFSTESSRNRLSLMLLYHESHPLCSKTKRLIRRVLQQRTPRKWLIN